MQNFCCEVDNIKRIKRQATDQKKMQQIKPPADGIQNLPRILKNKEKKFFSIEK